MTTAFQRTAFQEAPAFQIDAVPAPPAPTPSSGGAGDSGTLRRNRGRIWGRREPRLIEVLHPPVVLPEPAVHRFAGHGGLLLGGQATSRYDRFTQTFLYAPQGGGGLALGGRARSAHRWSEIEEEWLLGLADDLAVKAGPEDVLHDEIFWAEQKAVWLKVMTPLAREIFDAGVDAARNAPLVKRRKSLRDWLRRQKDFLDPDPEVLDNVAGQVFASYMDDWWAGLATTTRDALRSAIQDAAATGGGTPEVIDAIRPLFGDRRAILIGVTETTRLFGQGAVATYRASGVGQWQWDTSEDDHVCFPAGQMVATPSGERTIESLEAGELVLTPLGPRRIAKTMRSLCSGNLLRLRASNEAEFIATAKHPVWASGRWLELRQLLPGDLLQAVDNQSPKVVSVQNVALAKSEDLPAEFSKASVAATIMPSAGRMPVSTIGLDGDAMFREGEVERVAVDLEFLNELETKRLQSQAHLALDAALSPEPTIAGKRTKLTIAVAGQSAKCDPAMGATRHDRWPAAGFRAIKAWISRVIPKGFATAFTCLNALFGASMTAGERAAFKPISNRSPHGESLATDYANLRDESGLEFTAIAAAKLLWPAARKRTEGLAASFAGQVRGLPRSQVIANVGAIDTSTLAREAPELLAAGLAVENEFAIFMRSHPLTLPITIVYNLEVEDAHCYYVAGILVHNCDICDALDGQLFDVTEDFDPAHPGCRCWPAPVAP